MEARANRINRYFILGTLALSILAWVETQLARWPRPRLAHLIFDRLFVFTDEWGALLQVAIVVLVFAFPALRRCGSDLADVLDRRPAQAASITFVVCACAARFAYLATPFSMDEYSQTAQAYAFAHGHLTWFDPPQLLDRMIAPGFRNYFLATNPTTGEVASMYWPGFAALLTPFAWAGVPWLLNPVLAAMSVLLIHAIAVRISPAPASGGWALLLTLASPAFIINSISLYSMPAHLALNLLYLYLLLQNRLWPGFLAGVVGSVALVLHNPVPHMMFAAPWLVWLVHKPQRWPLLSVLLLGYLPCSLIVGFGWPKIIGAIMTPQTVAPHGIGAMWDAALTKLAGVVAFPDYFLVVARIYATWKIWIWSVPGLLLFALAGIQRARGPLLLVCLSAFLTYAFYWLVPFDQGHGWGYRYFYSAWAALPLLAARYLTAAPSADEDMSTLRGWMGGMSLASLVLANGFWFWQVHAVIGEHLAQRIPVPASGRWVVFLRAQPGLYSWDMIQNFPFDTHQLILMSFGPAADANLMAANFPNAKLVLEDARGSEWRLADAP